jgi:uncharacterized protein YpiB (UPF0302 family)
MYRFSAHTYRGGIRMNKMMKVSYEAMLALVAEMVLDKAVLKYRREQLYDGIDKALEAGDKDTFQRLTDELKTLAALHMSESEQDSPLV